MTWTDLRKKSVRSDGAKVERIKRIRHGDVWEAYRADGFRIMETSTKVARFPHRKAAKEAIEALAPPATLREALEQYGPTGSRWTKTLQEDIAEAERAKERLHREDPA